MLCSLRWFAIRLLGAMSARKGAVITLAEAEPQAGQAMGAARSAIGRNVRKGPHFEH
jgi:hypothetical protein